MPAPEGSPADIKVSSQLSAISFLPLFFLQSGEIVRSIQSQELPGGLVASLHRHPEEFLATIYAQSPFGGSTLGYCLGSVRTPASAKDTPQYQR